MTINSSFAAATIERPPVPRTADALVFDSDRSRVILSVSVCPRYSWKPSRSRTCRRRSGASTRFQTNYKWTHTLLEYAWIVPINLNVCGSDAGVRTVQQGYSFV